MPNPPPPPGPLEKPSSSSSGTRSGASGFFGRFAPRSALSILALAGIAYSILIDNPFRPGQESVLREGVKEYAYWTSGGVQGQRDKAATDVVRNKGTLMRETAKSSGLDTSYTTAMDEIESATAKNAQDVLIKEFLNSIETYPIEEKLSAIEKQKLKTILQNEMQILNKNSTSGELAALLENSARKQSADNPLISQYLFTGASYVRRYPPEKPVFQ